MGGNIIYYASGGTRIRASSVYRLSDAQVCAPNVPSYVRINYDDTSYKYTYRICLTTGTGEYFINDAELSELLDSNNVEMIVRYGVATTTLNNIIFTYSGSPQAMYGASTTLEDGSKISGNYTYTYYTDSACTENATTTAPTAAATYYVIATLPQETYNGQTYSSSKSNCAEHIIKQRGIDLSYAPSSSTSTYMSILIKKLTATPTNVSIRCWNNSTFTGTPSYTRTLETAANKAVTVKFQRGSTTVTYYCKAAGNYTSNVLSFVIHQL